MIIFLTDSSDTGSNWYEVVSQESDTGLMIAGIGTFSSSAVMFWTLLVQHCEMRPTSGSEDILTGGLLRTVGFTIYRFCGIVGENQSFSCVLWYSVLASYNLIVVIALFIEELFVNLHLQDFHWRSRITEFLFSFTDVFIVPRCMRAR